MKTIVPELSDFYNEHMRKSIIEGFEQGIEQGIERERIKTAKAMIKEGFDDRQIMKLTEITQEKIKELREEE